MLLSLYRGNRDGFERSFGLNQFPLPTGLPAAWAGSIAPPLKFGQRDAMRYRSFESESSAKNFGFDEFLSRKL